MAYDKIIPIRQRMDNCLGYVLNEEKNKARLEELKIYHAQKTCELVSLDRLSTVEDLLEKNGSALTVPEKPADKIK